MSNELVQTLGGEFTPEFRRELSNADVRQLFEDSWNESSLAFTTRWSRWEKLFDAYYGDTLSAIDKKYYAETKRPEIDLNIAIGTINAIVGADLTEQREVNFKGVDLDISDATAGELLSRTVRHYHTRSDGHRKESNAHLDFLICGYGWSRAYMDTSQVPIPPRIDHVPVFEMRPDPKAKEDGLTDAQYIIRTQKYTLEKAQARWPERHEQLRQLFVSGSSSALDGAPVQETVQDDWRDAPLNERRQTVEVHEFEFCRYEPHVVFQDPKTGAQEDIPVKDWIVRKNAMAETQERVAEELEALPEGSPPEMEQLLEEQFLENNPQGVTTYEYAKKVFYRAYIASNEANVKRSVMEFEKIEEGTYTYMCATGYRRTMRDGTVEFFGPMQTLYDAQMYLNRSARVIIETLGRGSKGGGDIEKRALIGTLEDYMMQKSVPGGWAVVNDGALSQKWIQPAGNVTMPQGFNQWFHEMKNMIEAITGVTDFYKGTATQERSNVLVNNMQGRSSQMLSPLMDSHASFKIRNGRLLAKLLLAHVSEKEIDKVIGRYDVPGVCQSEDVALEYQQQFEMEMEQFQENQMLFESMQGQPPPMDPATGQPMPPLPPPVPPQPPEQVPTPGAFLKNGTDPFAFDVTTDLGMASPTQRQQNYAVFSETRIIEQIMTVAPHAGAFLLPDFIRSLPLESAEMAQRMGDKLEEQLQLQGPGGQIPPVPQGGGPPTGGPQQ